MEAQSHEKPPAIQKRHISNFKSGSAESFRTTRTKFLNAPIHKQDEQSVTFSLKSDKPGKKIKKKGKQLRQHSFNPLEEEEKEKKRVQEMQECFVNSETQQEAYSKLKTLLLKHMRVLDDLTKLRNHYYVVYLSALTDKVDKQRKTIKKRTERMERKLKEKEEEKKRETQLARRKYERVVPPEDDTFIKDLFKSHWYKVIKLEEQMQKEGKLRTIEDYENFWEDIMRPEKYKEKFGKDEDDEHLQDNGSSHYISKASLHLGSCTSSVASMHTIDHQPQLARELSLIREHTDGPKPQMISTKDKKKLKSCASFLSVPVKGRRQDVHPKALELDKKYPKTELPHLRMLDMDLEPPKEDPEVVQMREEFNTRARIRNHKRKRVMNMHEMSLTHQAATSRILLNHPKFTARLEGPDIGDVSSAVKSMENPIDSQTPSLPTVVSAISWSSPFPNQRGTTPFFNEVIEELPESEEREAMLTRIASSSRGSSCRSSISSRESYHITETDREKTNSKEFGRQGRTSPSPLTLDSICHRCDLKEAKCLSTLWTNYGRELPAIT